MFVNSLITQLGDFTKYNHKGSITPGIIWSTFQCVPSAGTKLFNSVLAASAIPHSISEPDDVSRTGTEYQSSGSVL